MKLLYEGKAKKLFKGPDKGTVIQYFKDDATAFNGQKKDILQTDYFLLSWRRSF